MLTPLLEKAIFSGKAQAGIINGAGNSFVLDVPQNKFVIIHHIKAYGFVDVKVVQDIFSLQDSSIYCVHSLRIGGESSNQWLTMRTNIASVQRNGTTTQFDYLPTNNEDWDVYITGTKRVYFEWARFKSVKDWTTTIKAYPARYDNLAPNTGYGTLGTTPAGEPTLESAVYNDGFGTEYNPRGLLSIKSGTAQVSDFNPTINSNTNLNPPVSDHEANWQFPITTAMYVLCDGNPKDFFKQSL